MNFNNISFHRYGHHLLAAKIYEKLFSAVSLEKLHFFLEGLSQLSKAECILNYGCEYEEIANMKSHLTPTLSIAERLEKAVSLYWKALATFKVSYNPTKLFIHKTLFYSKLIVLGKLIFYTPVNLPN